MEEIWKNVRKGYQASNKGGIRSLDRWVDGKNGGKRFVKGKILNTRLDGGGYPIVNLYNNGKPKTEKVHRLVWEAFNGEIPEGMQINHISEDKTDNRLCNLNLLSHRDNCNFGTRNERSAKARINHPKTSKSIVQKTLQCEVIKVWASTMEIQRELGYNHSHISDCCNGKGKTAYGFIWQYEKATA